MVPVGLAGLATTRPCTGRSSCSSIATVGWKRDSGPVGSSRAPQPFLDGQLVREAQQRFEGWLQGNGHVEITCRMTLSPRSMAALWLAGWEVDPIESGELCVFEVFGRSIGAGPSAEVGMGIKRLRDPRLIQDFDARRLAIDVATDHLYAVDWDAAEATFSVDGVVVRRCPRPPTYPMQLMVAVFDFPGWSVGDDDAVVPSLEVDRIVCRR